MVIIPEGNTAKGVKNTPVCDELNHILTIRHGTYVVLIDDARELWHCPRLSNSG